MSEPRDTGQRPTAILLHFTAVYAILTLPKKPLTPMKVISKLGATGYWNICFYFWRFKELNRQALIVLSSVHC
jgi:hypothetical protein